MVNDTVLLSDKSLLIIFAYAPAGLGHLRVTDALYHGLPKTAATPLLLGSQDTTITFLHRLMSLNPIVRPMSDYLERGIAEDFVTAIYRKMLRSRTDVLYKQMLTIINERYTAPAKILVVATHFGLAHQLSAIKEKLEKELHIEMKLVIQVTDDSPHHIWYVPGADLIFVPSEKTKENLVRYGRSIGGSVPIVVNAYPLNPTLNKILPAEKLENKISQVDMKKTAATQVIIPISGAAVGTDYFTELIYKLHEKSDRYIFHVVCKDASFTKAFIASISDLPYIHLYTGSTDRKVVENYEFVYQENIISLEITKPSEQSFKALLSCDRQSASLLLFTMPVGSQEFDNLDFLYRHHLIPAPHLMKRLWSLDKGSLHSKDFSSWRGLCLPYDPNQAAIFINWCLENRFFSQMMKCRVETGVNDVQKNEIEPDGVKKFWDIVAMRLLK